MTFQLRFEPEKIRDLATQYSYGGEGKIINDVTPAIANQQYLTHENLVTLCYWKSPRIRGHCTKNPEDYIKVITHTSLTTSHERLRIEALQLLSGVSWPMASVILHWCHPEPYPILDFRALWSLGIDESPRHSFDFWITYTQFCRNLAKQYNVSMRTLDRALWQYSRMYQPTS